MGTTDSVTGYAVTLTVVVPFDTARQKADRLDAEWHLESWSPEAAAMRLAGEAVGGGGRRERGGGGAGGGCGRGAAPGTRRASASPRSAADDSAGREAPRGSTP